jgi:mono/diheme cytochrome c family protein
MLKRIAAGVIAFFVMSCAVLSADNSGYDIYALMCVSCHGKDGAGKTPAGQRFKLQDLRSPAVQDLSDTELYDAIATGTSTKSKEYPHAFLARGLTKAEIRSVVAYVRTLKKTKK